MNPEKRGHLTVEAAEMLAIDALGWMAGDDDTLNRFLALTGLTTGDLRSAASEPGFLAGVLDYLASDEPLLLAYAEHAGIPPQRIAAAHFALSGGEI